MAQKIEEKKIEGINIMSGSKVDSTQSWFVKQYLPLFLFLLFPSFPV